MVQIAAAADRCLPPQLSKCLGRPLEAALRALHAANVVDVALMHMRLIMNENAVDVPNAVNGVNVERRFMDVYDGVKLPSTTPDEQKSLNGVLARRAQCAPRIKLPV